MSTRASGRARGFTLIELLAAMAVLAVVSVMAVQSLGGAMRQRDILSRTDDRAAALERTLALLRHDLESAAPIALGVAAGADLPCLIVSGDGFSLMRAGVGDDPAAFARVDWRVADGRLTRSVWGAPPQVSRAGPAVALLQGVSALRLTPVAGRLPDAENPTRLPAGFDLRFDHDGFGALRLVVAR